MFSKKIRRVTYRISEIDYQFRKELVKIISAELGTKVSEPEFFRALMMIHMLYPKCYKCIINTVVEFLKTGKVKWCNK